jgi:hypothetical protein
MHLKFRNCNDAFSGITRGIYSREIPTKVSPSRAGEVAVIEEPVITSYERPCERVLFNQARDANPFFHLFESLWMLAGRNDVKPLLYYNSNIAEVASDDGETFNGAYGYRWRHVSGMDDWKGQEINHGQRIDQLDVIADRLKNHPQCRRCVLQMWNVYDDLTRIDWTKDICCNTHAYFSVREGQYLDMTVCNRSNDFVWGALGANVVHFSVLQEYLAARIGVAVGWYHQFTNNLHVYTSRWTPEKYLKDTTPDWYSLIGGTPLELISLVHDPARFDDECSAFIDDMEGNYREPFICGVAAEMCLAFRHHKERDYVKAFEAIERVKSEDWRIAGSNWLQKRRDNWEGKHENVYLKRELKRQVTGSEQA